MIDFESSSITDWIETIVVVLGGGAAVFRYYLNSSQTKAIRIADEMDALSKSEAAKVVTRMFDWSSTYVSLQDSSGNRHNVFVSEQTFLLAVRNHDTSRNEIPKYDESEDKFAQDKKSREKENWKMAFSPEEQLIRDAFDDFLGRLERIESLIKRRVIAKEDFRHHFSYWLDLLDENGRNAPSYFSHEKRVALWAYIRRYKFDGVVRLFTRFGKVKRFSAIASPAL